MTESANNCNSCGAGLPDDPKFKTGKWNCAYCAQRIKDEKTAEDFKVKRNLLALGGERAYRDFTVEKFIKTAANQSALAAAVAFNPEKENIYFHGSPGTGKTHLATIAARKHLGIKMNNDRFCPVRVIKPTEIFRAIRAADGADAEKEVITGLVNLPVLVLEDLGVEKYTEFALTSIFEIIDGRYMAMVGGLIITSNLDLNALAQKMGDDRIVSRLAQMCSVFKIGGEDWRLKK